MAGFSDFIGVWHAGPGHPYSTHTITWKSEGLGLTGSWLIEAAEWPAGVNTPQGDWPKRFEMQLSEPTLEDGRLLFHINGGPFVTEFKMVSVDEAEVGAALDKLPPQFAGPEHRRSMDGHRVRVTRRSTT